MWRYIIKRIVVFIPMFFAISLLAFFISKQSPIDPVDRLTGSPDLQGGTTASLENNLKERQEVRRLLGLDKPTFYFSLNTLADCDTLYRVPDKSIRDNLEYLTRVYGNWDYISEYYLTLKQSYNNTLQITDKATNKESIEVASIYLILLQSGSESYVTNRLKRLENVIKDMPDNSVLKADLKRVKSAHSKMISSSSNWKNFIPAIQWNGVGNQYHEWIFGNQTISETARAGSDGLIRGDLGISFINKREITTDIFKKFRISFELVLFSVILAYLVSIPVGVYSAYKRNSIFDKGSGIILFILYSIPNFFVGLLLLNYFANPEHYEWFNGVGYKSPEIASDVYFDDWNYMQRLQHSWPYMILPLFTYTYAQFAFISRIMRVGMLDIMGADYIRTARAKGLSEWKVVMKHALKNALGPIITVFASVFPLAVGGSVVIETIFDYEGMGREIITAIQSNDYPVVIVVFSLAGLLTMTGYLVSDILYALTDPRISYTKSRLF